MSQPTGVDSAGPKAEPPAPPAGRRLRAGPAAVMLIFGALLAVYAGQLWFHLTRASATFDEPVHVLAGYRHWQCGDFGINPEHPPLLKLLAAAPAMWQGVPPPPWPCGARLTPKWEGFHAGARFLADNGVDRVLVPARMAAALMSLLLAVLVFLTAREMFGGAEALVALALLTFEPTLVAHGSLVTTDMALAATTCGAVYALYRYRLKPSAPRLLLAGAAFGLALASKHSGLFMLPTLFLLVVADSLLVRRSGEGARRGPLYGAAACAAVAAVGIAVLWASYGFRYYALPGAGGPSLPTASGGWLRLLSLSHVFPESYVYGLLDVVLSRARSTFLLGHVYPTGRWFYFPVAFTIKSSVALLLLTPLALLTRGLYREHARAMLFLLLPAAVYFAVGMASGLNIGVRHILPVYPFFIVVAAAGAVRWARRRRALLYALPVLLLFHAAAALRAAPDYIAFANDFWGGTKNTHRLLHESNVEWGQNLKAVESYVRREGGGDCWLAYFGEGELARVNQRCRLLPAFGWELTSQLVEPVPPVIEGTVLLSSSVLPPLDTQYEAVARAEPVAIIGGSILVYRGRFEVPRAAAQSHVMRAEQLIGQRRFQEALADARRAVELAPDDPGAHLWLGASLSRVGEREEARRELLTAVRLAGSNPDLFYSAERQARRELDALK